MTIDDFHKDYGLILRDINPQDLSNGDVPVDLWMNKKCKDIKLESFPSLWLLHFMAYEEALQKMELSLCFARDYIYE